MSREPRLYLEDMQTACRKIVHYTAGMSRQDFLRDDKTYDAVIRNLEIIGEAAKNVPEEIQKRYQVEGRSAEGWSSALGAITRKSNKKSPGRSPDFRNSIF